MGKPRLSDEERGELGAWAYHARIAAGFSNTDKVAAKLKIRILPDTIRGIEAGHQGISPDLLDELQALYGSTAPTVATEAPSGGLGALWAAVGALRATVDELEARLVADEAALADHLARHRAGRTPDGSKR